MNFSKLMNFKPIKFYYLLHNFKNDISKRENMTYNAEDYYYICAYGI